MTGAIPFRLRHDGAAPQVEWLLDDGQPFREPFFDLTVSRLTRENPANRASLRRRTGLEALRDIEPGLPPSALIFHVSRCGSTLMAQMLAALPANRVISEPAIIDDILQLPRRNPAVTDDDRIAWLRGAVHALGARRAGVERLFIKLDCWHLFALPLLARAFPGVPRVFVFRHPVEVLASLMRLPSFTLVRDVVTLAQLGLTAEVRDSLGQEDYAAAVLGAFFREARQHRAELIPAAYEQLQDFVGGAMPGCAFSPEEKQLLRAATAWHAKKPGERFVPDSAEKRRSAGPAILAASARWADAPYAAWLASLPPRPTDAQPAPA